jgi:hypothetical protein
MWMSNFFAIQGNTATTATTATDTTATDDRREQQPSPKRARSSPVDEKMQYTMPNNMPIKMQDKKARKQAIIQRLLLAQNAQISISEMAGQVIESEQDDEDDEDDDIPVYCNPRSAIMPYEIRQSLLEQMGGNVLHEEMEPIQYRSDAAITAQNSNGDDGDDGDECEISQYKSTD